MTNQAKEHQYCSINYERLPVTITKGEGIYLWDENNTRYFDFLSGYSVINQGHCHPRLVAAATELAEAEATKAKAEATKAKAEADKAKNGRG